MRIIRQIIGLFCPRVLTIQLDLGLIYKTIKRADKDITRDGNLDNIMTYLKSRVITSYCEYEGSKLPTKEIK